MSEEWKHLSGSLNTASTGQELAEAVLRALDASSDVLTLDFSEVDRMTPSFANAFVMLLLDRYSVETLRSRVRFLNRKPNVADAMNRSADRYRRGIRLSL